MVVENRYVSLISFKRQNSVVKIWNLANDRPPPGGGAPPMVQPAQWLTLYGANVDG